MKHLIIITAIAFMTCVTAIAADKAPQRPKPHRRYHAPALTMPPPRCVNGALNPSSASMC